MEQLNTIKQLMLLSTGKNIPKEFASQNIDYNAALRDEISKYIGHDVKGAKRYYEMQKGRKWDIYALLAETIDEIWPREVVSQVQKFAEVRQLSQGEALRFLVKRGKQRAKNLFVTKSTEAGVFETFRLDKDYIDVPVFAHGGAGIIDFERYLDGVEDIMDVYNTMIASWNDNARPAANKVYMNNFNAIAMRNLCNTVKAYGDAIIYATPEFLSEMLNVIYAMGDHAWLPDFDRNDIRAQGFIGRFYGTPIVAMQNSFTDETNTKLAMNPRFAFVLPTNGEKIVKIAYSGDTIIKEIENQDWGMEVQAYKKFGSAVVATPNHWGIAYNAGISAGGWEDVQP